MRETWYVLEDGSNGDPRDVAPDDNGVLRHKSGVAVKIGPHGNHVSRGVEVEEQRPVGKSSRNRQVKADDDGPKYKTR